MSKRWTINVTLIVENKDFANYDSPPTMAELMNIFATRGFEFAMPRDTGDPFVLYLTPKEPQP